MLQRVAVVVHRMEPLKISRFYGGAHKSNAFSRRLSAAVNLHFYQHIDLLFVCRLLAKPDV